MIGMDQGSKGAPKRSNDTVRESEQGRRRFVRRLDHEIKNPLTGIRAALVNLQEAAIEG